MGSNPATSIRRSFAQRTPESVRHKEIVMPINRLKQFLDEHNIKYVVISHSVAYTAQGIAALAHIPGKELAKARTVKMHRPVAKAGRPGARQGGSKRLERAAHANSVELA